MESSPAPIKDKLLTPTTTWMNLADGEARAKEARHKEHVLLHSTQVNLRNREHQRSRQRLYQVEGGGNENMDAVHGCRDLDHPL